MDINKLLEKYRQGNCTDEERALVESWYLHYEEDNLPEISDAAKEQQLQDVWELLPIHQQTPVKRINAWPRMAAAAVLLIAASICFYFYSQKNTNTSTTNANNQAHAIVPGGNKAVLTLANGSKITLTGAHNGLINTQAGVKIVKKADGQLVYDAKNSADAADHSYNTIETPRGGQYQVVLPDGSKVWLNAATTLRYPANFAGLKERHVELNGEAYFEVAHNADCPFTVTAGNQQIKVLGTHFNIMAYNDEGMVKTTLLQGSVRLTSGAVSGLLKPGEQGSFPDNSLFVVPANVDEITAWKNGMFVFNNTDMYALMRQLSRWYDVNVEYEPGVKSDVFFGKIERSSGLNKVLKILELGGVHFRVEGRKLIVMK
jgi:transmembrane sensor